MTFNNNPQMRELPLNVPSQVTLKVYPTEFHDSRRGITREQWQANYRPADARNLRDLVKVVVNFHHNQDPQSGETWEVQMLYRAPKVDIVFANAIRRIQQDPKPVAEVKTIEHVGDKEHELAKRTICAWMSQLPSKLVQLRARFRRG